MNFKNLKNNYFIMRHGRSIANEEGIILGDPKNGIDGYGLTEEGMAQALASAKKAKDEGILDDNTIIISSDFLRAMDTAGIVRKVLNCGPIIVSTKLRERFFGKWEKTSYGNYQDVWNNDIKSVNDGENNVESIKKVADRVTALVDELEKKYSGKNILLVSHGDTLQILQAIVKLIPISDHMQFRLENAEIRKLEANFCSKMSK